MQILQSCLDIIVHWLVPVRKFNMTQGSALPPSLMVVRHIHVGWFISEERYYTIFDFTFARFEMGWIATPNISFCFTLHMKILIEK